ncbi:MAG: NAD-dependent epimerase/dehydratase family protein [Nanoarchaeota archaeon]|nr:NAD-dependent epimerase/dehydratase family protein [Nanoarchaeota archaeon]
MESRIIKEDIRRIAEELKEVYPQLKGKTVLIAGGAGFLGRYLVMTLDYLNKNSLEEPCKIIILDNFITGIKESLHLSENVILIQQDISKPFSINEDIDYIIHAASLASPVFYNKFKLETIDVGFLGTKNLLNLAREKKVKSFIFFSSSEVYGNPDPKFIPTPESYLGNVSCIGPRAPYDEPKRIGETLCMTYADIYNLPVKIVRPFNIYGPGMRFDDGRVVPNFVVTALKGEKIPIYGDGYNTRTFCYISDAIVGFYKILLSDFNREVFNIGSDEQEIQMKHLAELVHGLVENDFSQIHKIEGPNEAYSAKADPNRRCPDLTKIRTMLGYNVRISLVLGLKRFIAWAKEEMDARGLSHKLERQCRICNNSALKTVLSLGKTPLANNLLSESELNKEELFPLELMYCNSCHLCQLSYVTPPEKLFKHYVYVTSTTETFKEHFRKMALELSQSLNLNSSSLVVDIGSNDGLLLKNFKDMGIRVIGVEPAENIASIARNNGIDTISDFFNEVVAEDILRIKGKADLITANNVFAHVGNIKELTNNVKKVLSAEGVFCIEVQYLLDTIQKLTFDNIYHEHLSYFSVLSLEEFFKRNEMQIFRVEHEDSHGGSIRVFVGRKGSKHQIEESVQKFINIEKQAGLDKSETYEKFAEKVYTIRDKFQSFIKNVKNANKRIIGYGAPAKATTFLNFCKVDKGSLEYIVEDNPLKHGLIVPGVKIPIVSKEILEKDSPDYITVLAWNFAEEILRKNEHHKKRGIKFVLPYPDPVIISD